MGAFLLWLGTVPGAHCDDQAWLQACAQTAHRGPKGTRQIDVPGLRLSWFQSGTPSESEAGEQPLKCGTRWWLLDGWGIDGPTAAATSRLAESYQNRGLSALGEWRGHGSFLMMDPEARECLVARDPGGARHVYLRRDHDALWLASDPCALLSSTGGNLDPEQLGHYLLARAPQPPATFFHGITAVPAGSIVRLTSTGSIHLGRLREPEVTLATRERGLIDQFNALLDQAVTRSLRGARSPGLTASGGMDSGAIAGAAARRKHLLRLHSWSLPSIPESDEGEAVQALGDHLGFPVSLFAGDRYAPLAGGERPHWPGYLRSNPYRELKHALYREAQAAGRDLLLNGDGGDQLYGDPNLHFVELWQGHQWFALARELSWRWRTRGWQSVWQDHAVRRWLRQISGTKAHPGVPPGAWTDWALPRLLPLLAPQSSHWMDRAALSGGIADEHAWAESLGLEVRSPMRDPDLMAFMRQLPAHYRRRAGVSKWLTRRALMDVLPAAHLGRGKTGNLTPFLIAALRRSKMIDALVAEIPGEVNAWLDRGYWNTGAKGSNEDSALLLYWQGLALALRLRSTTSTPYPPRQVFLG